MISKSTINVGFGISGIYVVAWYCGEVGGNISNGYQQNVCPVGGCVICNGR